MIRLLEPVHEVNDPAKRSFLLISSPRQGEFAALVAKLMYVVRQPRIGYSGLPPVHVDPGNMSMTPILFSAFAAQEIFMFALPMLGAMIWIGGGGLGLILIIVVIVLLLRK
jgi:hypothetical protein